MCDCQFLLQLRVRFLKAGHLGVDLSLPLDGLLDGEVVIKFLEAEIGGAREDASAAEAEWGRWYMRRLRWVVWDIEESVRIYFY